MSQEVYNSFLEFWTLAASTLVLVPALTKTNNFAFFPSWCTVLYCTVLYCTVLYCTQFHT